MRNNPHACSPCSPGAGGTQVHGTAQHPPSSQTQRWEMMALVGPPAQVSDQLVPSPRGQYPNMKDSLLHPREVLQPGPTSV